MLYRSVRFAAAAALLLLLAACASPSIPRPLSASIDLRCANGYMKAMTHTNFEAMYSCMGGDLRHRLEERADARNRTPVVQLAWDQAILELATTGQFQLLKHKVAPTAYQLWDQDEALLYRFGTVGGDMGIVLLIDHRGFVGGLVGPFYSSG